VKSMMAVVRSDVRTVFIDLAVAKPGYQQLLGLAMQNKK